MSYNAAETRRPSVKHLDILRFRTAKRGVGPDGREYSMILVNLLYRGWLTDTDLDWLTDTEIHD